MAAAEDVVATREDLVAEGKIRWFGTAQDDAEGVAVFARSDALRDGADPGERVRLVDRDAGRRPRPRTVRVGPLAVGHGTAVRPLRHRRPAPGDVRLDTPWWNYFDDDTMGDWLSRLASVRELLTVGGRTLVQGALGYLWTVDPAIIPLPGVRTVEQARENAAALAVGPLPPTPRRRSPSCWPTLPSAADRSRRISRRPGGYRSPAITYVDSEGPLMDIWERIRDAFGDILDEESDPEQ